MKARQADELKGDVLPNVTIIGRATVHDAHPVRRVALSLALIPAPACGAFPGHGETHKLEPTSKPRNCGNCRRLQLAGAPILVRGPGGQFELNPAWFA